MSTILKALKKLETEKAPEADPAEPVQSTPSKVTIGKEGARSKNSVILIVSGCVLLGFLWVGYRLYFSPPSTSTAPPPPVPDHPDSGLIPDKPDAGKIKPLIDPPVEKPTAQPTPPLSEKAPNTRRFSEDGDTRPLPAEKPTKREAPTARPVDIQIVDDPRLQLQAIAWSEQAKDRIAVINGSLVREGGQVKGVTIIEIGVDVVVFEEGGRRWKQKF